MEGLGHMKLENFVCPYCEQNIYFDRPYTEIKVYASNNTEAPGYEVAHGLCPSCRNLIITVSQGSYDPSEDNPILSKISSREIVFPTYIEKIRHESIPENYRFLYNEAHAIRILSPSSCAVICRKLLETLLIEKFNIRDGDLQGKIQAFISKHDPKPSLRKKLEQVRLVGNAGSHKTPLPVDQDEAEWLLSIVEEIFVLYFIRVFEDNERQNETEKKIQTRRKQGK